MERKFSLVKLAIAAVMLLLPTAGLAVCDLPVSRISDGDTFHAPTKTRLSATKHLEENSGFRLLRVYAPERKEEGYAKAKADLVDLIGGKSVEIKFDLTGPKRDKYGRFLVNVYLCDGRKRLNVNQKMAELGWTGSGRGVPKK